LNPGGEPGRDESGLPPVDIEIPDDARELDRDVQAYHRELRAARRQRRGLRFRGSLAKDGVMLPLLACCLILALITGTLLTVFTATSDPTLGTFPGSGTSTSRPPTGSSGPASAQPPPLTASGTYAGLPSATITVPGKRPMSVQALSQAALVLVPSHCNCTDAVSWLIGVVVGAHARPYLLYTPSTKTDAAQLLRSLPTSTRARVQLAATPADTLRASIPRPLPRSGLEAIFIGRTKISVLYATGFASNEDPTTLIEALNH